MPGGGAVMKLILLLYLIVALFSPAFRRAPAVLWARFWLAFGLWRVLRRPWRVAWTNARRRVT